MSDEIAKCGGSPPQTVNNEYVFNNNGGGDLFAHTDTYNKQMNLIVLDVGGRKVTAGSDFYSLIIGMNPFGKDHFTMMTVRSLTESMNDELKRRFLPLTLEGIEEIKKRPVLIAQECAQREAQEQKAAAGFIRDIQKRENGYEIYYQAPFTVDMEVVWQNKSELGIPHPFELTRTHWTLKQIDLFEVLKDAGVDWFQNLGR